jgi:hypothetical protein
MSISHDNFGPIATVVNWLDFCRSGEAGLLLSLYDEDAVIERGCEKVSLIGREALEAYWRLRLRARQPFAFDLEDVKPDTTGITLDHRNYRGERVRTQQSRRARVVSGAACNHFAS